jgi:hypothetical protein
MSANEFRADEPGNTAERLDQPSELLAEVLIRIKIISGFTIGELKCPSRHVEHRPDVNKIVLRHSCIF